MVAGGKNALLSILRLESGLKNIKACTLILNLQVKSSMAEGKDRAVSLSERRARHAE